MNEKTFDPGGVGIKNGNYFGFPWTAGECPVVIVNVPWDATTSYRRGTARGPESMIAASVQLDFYPFDNPGSGVIRCGTDNSLMEKVQSINQAIGNISQKIITKLESGIPQSDPAIVKDLECVNDASVQIEKLVCDRCSYWLGEGKQVIVAGGEHSVPLGLIKALSKHNNGFGILQIDAHADLRIAYEGFNQSHASIMHNALQIDQVTKIVQVGIRDVSPAEMELALKDPRIHPVSDFEIKTGLFAGRSWFEKCRDIVSLLPQKVYVSFDIDGLEPQYCPNTGTPVAGGLTPDEALYLIRVISESGRSIIGADLCEVAPGNDEWDASTGARILYRLALLIHHSNYPTLA